MSKISVGCRVDISECEQIDLLASQRGMDRAGFLRAAIARELGNEPPGDLAQELAQIKARVASLENILMAMAGAIARL